MGISLPGEPVSLHDANAIESNAGSKISVWVRDRKYLFCIEIDFT